MERRYDILIFSIFGRNTWLAAQLRALGLTVAFLDLTSMFQKGLPEDWEGPFPLIFSDTMERSYSQSLTDQGQYEVLHRGPSLRWKSHGLFEFKSDHAKFLTQQWGQESLWFFEEDVFASDLPKNIEFKNHWLKAFLMQWRSSRLMSLPQVLAAPQIPDFALNSHYVIRHPDREVFLHDSDWLAAVGVDVLPLSSWWKCESNGSKSWTLKLDNEGASLEAKQLMLGLTSYELHRFSGQIILGESSVQIPKAFWMRWSGRCEEEQKLDFIPTYSMYLSDIEMGLCNENFLTLIKRPNKQLDVWSLVTREILSEQNFLEDLQFQISDRLKYYVPELWDLRLEGPRLGADLYSFWPVYDEQQKPRMDSPYLIYDNPEVWPALDNYSRYQFQKNLIKSFKKSISLERGVNL